MPESTKPHRVWKTLAVVLAPLLMLLFCGAVLLLCGIRPYERMTTYLNIAFMDTHRVDDPNAGLIIKDKDIQTDYSGEVKAEGVVIRPEFGEQYARLKSDAISLNVPVYWGSNATLLTKGACQSNGSKLVGEVGNAVIDAHVNTFFKDLSKLKVGDTLSVYTDYGAFTYIVRETISFDKTDKTYVLPTDNEQLTLYTCVADVLGSPSARVGVICDIQDKQFYQTAQTGEGTTE